MTPRYRFYLLALFTAVFCLPPQVGAAWPPTGQDREAYLTRWGPGVISKKCGDSMARLRKRLSARSDLRVLGAVMSLPVLIGVMFPITATRIIQYNTTRALMGHAQAPIPSTFQEQRALAESLAEAEVESLRADSAARRWWSSHRYDETDFKVLAEYIEMLDRFPADWEKIPTPQSEEEISWRRSLIPIVERWRGLQQDPRRQHFDTLPGLQRLRAWVIYCTLVKARRQDPRISTGELWDDLHVYQPGETRPEKLFARSEEK